MLNEVILMGRLTVTPELRSTNSGKSVCSFGLAVDRGSKDENVDFLDIACFDKSAEFAAKYLQKGRQIALRGQLRTNEWTDKDGKKRKSYNVVASQIFFADSKPQDAPATSPAPPQLEPYNEDDGDLPF